MPSPSVTLLMGIGPGPQELDRLADFFDALWCWEPAAGSVVLIDDAPEPRVLEQLFFPPPGFRIHSIHHPRRGQGVGVWGALTEGILMGLDHIAEHEPAPMILKIDTDGHVIAPFAERAEAVFAAHPKVGMMGLHDTTCHGTPRPYDPWVVGMFNYSLPVAFRKSQPIWHRRLQIQLFGQSALVRKRIKAAQANGYTLGEHCVGGAYMLRLDAVKDLRGQGMLREPSFWRHTHMSEDVVVSLYMRAAGWQLLGQTAPGQLFGVQHKGIPFSPEEMLAKGYALTHAVKNDERYSEADIRAFFKAKRQPPR